MKIGKFVRRKNILFIGSSGSGMSRFFVKPQQQEYPERVKEREHKKERGMER